MSLKKTIGLQIKKVSDRLSRSYTLEEVVKQLEENSIFVRGNITNTPKRKILLDSLHLAKEKSLVHFLQKVINSKYHKAILDKNKAILLHKNFKGTKVEKFISTGDYEEAVRVAFIRLNNVVKTISNLQNDGVSLMRAAFSRNRPVIKINALLTQEDFDEQEGMMHIFEGSMLAFRNPHSHNDEKKLTFDEAKLILQIANYLMSILDRLVKRRKSQG